jgi:hypothetical protein
LHGRSRWRRCLSGFLFNGRCNRRCFHRFQRGGFLNGFLGLGNRDCFRGLSLVEFCLYFSPKLIGEAVLNGVGVRRYWHSHVLQLPNNLRVIEVQLARELINPKFLATHESLILPLLCGP